MGDAGKRQLAGKRGVVEEEEEEEEEDKRRHKGETVK